MWFFRHDKCNVHTFNNAFATPIVIIFITLFLLLGSPNSVLAKTASQAISDFDSIMGTPDDFVEEIYSAAEDFMKDHFASLVVAVAFSLGLKAIVK